MVRNIVIVGGSSHPQLTTRICAMLGIPPAQTILSKFAVGETRVEIQDSVRGKDVYVVQSGSGRVNDNLMELLITISACKTASAKTVTAVMPLFPYSRQPDIPYNKTGAPLSKAPSVRGDSRPETPNETRDTSPTSTPIDTLSKALSHAALERNAAAPAPPKEKRSCPPTPLRRSETTDSLPDPTSAYEAVMAHKAHLNKPPTPSLSGGECNPFNHTYKPNSGYRQWVAQAGTLVADLLSCAGADHIITMDLHDAQYQGFFDIPVDNLYARPLLKRYIQRNIPSSAGDLVIVSPDAGGAKRATQLADSLQMEFALIHKVNDRNDLSEHYPPAFVSSWADEVAESMGESNGSVRRTPGRYRPEPTMMLVGDLQGKIAIIVDDLADTCVTITRAAKLVKEKGATKVYALVTHAVLSGDACERINESEVDKLVVTNTVPQEEHLRRCTKLEVLDVAGVFAEAIRRVHHGESISVLFQFD
ncbi:ribose-phosphate pyrophosphokinase I [Ascobolus immersus RN42]|uniref:Ribose-phosphate pyrophosphokinase I n=1 Tax=Ascobolus immersus RN42 TaxID=1160509 RepID=A0A3N4HF45_ASCIM|nr:ribose-phosphate pyrophosphokinase I [Ascobolus immersus RN42]